MKAVTGEAVVLSMLELAMDINRWNKQYTTKTTLQNMMAELGLTPHQLEVLGFMYENPELNTVSQLAAELFISKGSLSLMLSKLQMAGFLKKQSARGEDDGRKVYMTLTKKGTNAVKTIRDSMVSSAAVAFDGMDEKTRTLFYTKVKELKELFNAGGLEE